MSSWDKHIPLQSRQEPLPSTIRDGAKHSHGPTPEPRDPRRDARGPPRWLSLRAADGRRRPSWAHLAGNRPMHTVPVPGADSAVPKRRRPSRGPTRLWVAGQPRSFLVRTDAYSRKGFACPARSVSASSSPSQVNLCTYGCGAWAEGHVSSAVSSSSGTVLRPSFPSTLRLHLRQNPAGRVSVGRLPIPRGSRRPGSSRFLFGDSASSPFPYTFYSHLRIYKKLAGILIRIASSGAWAWGYVTH